MVITVNSI
jgi:hypothetical protein